jgi:hypothetical protein
MYAEVADRFKLTEKAVPEVPLTEIVPEPLE